MSEHSTLAFNLGVASAVALAEKTADIIEAEGDMAGARDPVSVEALRTFAVEAGNLFRPVHATDEEA